MPVPVTRTSVIDVLQLLVSTPSVNPDLAPDEGHNEKRIAQVSAQWLSEHGVQSWVDEVEPGRCNAIGRVGQRAPLLVFCGHIDTVSTAGMTIPPFEPRIDGNRLYGRGAVDMKGGVAAIMCALGALVHEQLPGSVMGALVCDEEYASKGAEAFVKRYAADACILTEPALGGPSALVLAHKGFVWAELATHGFATHGSRWDLGVSAIGKMSRIVSALEQFDRDVLRKRMHPLVGPASLHCATIAGGTGWSTYAAECRLQVERRTIPGETPEQVLRELNEVVGAAGEAAEIRLVFERPPMTCPADAPLADCARRALQQATGSAPRDTGVAYWMDAAIFDQAGVPTVNFGSDGAGAHEAVEWVDIDTVVQVSNALVYAARDYLRLSAAPAAGVPG